MPSVSGTENKYIAHRPMQSQEDLSEASLVELVEVDLELKGKGKRKLCFAAKKTTQVIVETVRGETMFR